MNSGLFKDSEGEGSSVKASSPLPSCATSTARNTKTFVASVSPVGPHASVAPSGPFVDGVAHAGRIFIANVGHSGAPRGDMSAPARPAPTAPAVGVKYNPPFLTKTIKESCVSDFLGGGDATPKGPSVSPKPTSSSRAVSQDTASPSVSSQKATRPTLTATRYKGLCGTAVCCIVNPLSGHYCKIRVLIDSGANLSLIDRALAKAVGLSGQKQVVTINTADGGSRTHEEVEVAFQLAKRDKSFVTQPIIALVSDALGNPFPSINLVPSEHEYLKGITLAEEFPSPPSLPFHLLMSPLSP